MGENEPNSKASYDSSSLLDEESVALGSLLSGGISRQYAESGSSSSTQNVPLQDEAIEVGVDNTDKRIYGAVALGDHKTLFNLLNSCTTEVHPIDIKGNTALHFAVASACSTGDRDDSLYRCIDVLMSCEQMKVNMPNKKGYTAIGDALNELHKECVEHMLRHPSAKRLYLDYYPGDREFTVKEIIMETYPDLKPLLKEWTKEDLDLSEGKMKRLAALQHGKYDNFIETLDSNNPNPWYDEPYHSSLLEIACQMKNCKQFVTHLLENGADPNIKNRVTGMPLLHATARSGNLELLELLLNKDPIDVNVKDSEDRTILHWWARVSEKNPNDMETLKSCFKLLRDKSLFENGSIEEKDISGNTPFSIAVAREHRDRIILMLDVVESDTEYDHVCLTLESASKSLLEAILYYCIDSSNEPRDSEQFKVTLNFNALIKMMYFAADSVHKEILKHPVMSIFLNLLWKKLKMLFFLNVALYVTFLLSLTTYILFSEFCNIQNNGDVANNTNGFLSDNDSKVTCGMSDERRYNISQGLWYALMILLGLLSLRELGQLIAYRKEYIMSQENWLELLLLVVTFTSCSGVVDSSEGNRHLFAIAILLGWFELVLILGRLPQLSVQIEMFKKVSLTFLEFMAGYIVLILAFAFSFYILFEENAEVGDAALFSNPLISILKIIVMFAGEFEASSLPFDTLPGTSHVIFLLFVFFVAIVLLNLLQGLAVGDTRKVREDAETLSLVARIRLITYIFDVYIELPYFIKRHLAYEYANYELFPKKEKIIGPSLQSIVNEKLERNKKEKTIDNVENWKLFTEKLSTLESDSKETRQMLKKILTHLNIPEP